MELKLIEFENKIADIAKSMNLSIYDILYTREGGYEYLQVFIENILKETDLEDCVTFSNAIDKIVDDEFDEKFFLEVSTPGLDKKLRKVDHFIRVIDKRIEIKTKSNIENSRKFIGKLIEVSNNEIIIDDEKLQKKVSIEFNKIKDSKLIYEIPNNIEEEYEK